MLTDPDIGIIVVHIANKVHRGGTVIIILIHTELRVHKVFWCPFSLRQARKRRRRAHKVRRRSASGIGLYKACNSGTDSRCLKKEYQEGKKKSSQHGARGTDTEAHCRVGSGEGRVGRYACPDGTAVQRGWRAAILIVAECVAHHHLVVVAGACVAAGGERSVVGGII